MQPGDATCDVGYVVHTYPSVSHTFVQREVLGVRRAGGRVLTFSIHRATATDVLSATDGEEAAQTSAILPVRPWRFGAAHLRAFRTSPGEYVATLLHALAGTNPGPRDWLWQMFYFAEAIVLWDLASCRGVRHLHAHLSNVAADACWLASHFGRRVEPEGGWCWSMTVHGPTEFFDVRRYNLTRKVAEADLVVCISDFCRSQVMANVAPRHWSKLRVVHCGVDLSRYHYRAPWTSPDQALRVLCVGRLVPEKGQALLIEAASVMRDAGRPVKLTFVGGGPDDQMLGDEAHRRLLGDDVTFTGPVGQDELPAVFTRHDVFCLPSFAEGVPVVLMEAMAAGLPVVGTRIAGVPELVEHGQTGLLVAPGRVDLLVEALSEVVDAPDRTVRMSANARLKVEKDFDAERCAADLAAIFADLEGSQVSCRGER